MVIERGQLREVLRLYIKLFAKMSNRRGGGSGIDDKDIISFC